MADDIITARVVFERGGAGLGGVAGTGPTTTRATGGKGGGLLGAAGIKMGAAMASVAAAVAVGVILIKGIKTAVEKLAKFSPRLAASISIFRKSFEMMLRPIGDVLSMFLRPFAIMMLRWGIKFYKKYAERREEIEEVVGEFGPVKLAKGGEMTTQDWMETYGAIMGDIPVLMAAAFMEFDWTGTFNNIGGWFQSSWEETESWFSNTLMPGIETAWTTFAGVMIAGFEGFGSWVENDLVPGIENAWSSFGNWIDETFITNAKSAWSNLGSWITDDLVPGIESAWTAFGNWFEGGIIEPIQNSWAGIVGWFDENILGPIKSSWESITGWFDENVITPIKNAWDGFVDWIKEIFSFDWLNLPDWIPGFQTGGYATQEGLYHLHQGETVLPAGATNNFNTSPTINVNANVNNDMDLNNLAERLSEITMQKINSQMSYRF